VTLRKLLETSKLRRIWPGRHASTAAIAFVLLTWVPLLVLAAIAGPLPMRSVLLDVRTHVRLLLIGPITILAEPFMDRVLASTTNYFKTSGLVPDEEREAFDALVGSNHRVRDGGAARVLVIAIAYVFSWWQIEMATDSLARIPVPYLAQIPAAFGWYEWVSRPLLLSRLVRWLWRMSMWTVFLRRTSRLGLRLSAAHPDRAGGLGFLSITHARFGVVAFPFALGWAGGFRERILYGNLTVGALKGALFVFVGAMAFVFVGPLLVLVPKLFRLRERALVAYGQLGNEYCRLFEQRWLHDGAADSESLLGTSDIQSFADLQNTVGAIRAMRVMPIDKAVVGAFALATCLPLLRLADLIWPLEDLIRKALVPFF
jgi:hypothetical protein